MDTFKKNEVRLSRCMRQRRARSLSSQPASLLASISGSEIFVVQAIFLGSLREQWRSRNNDNKEPTKEILKEFVRNCLASEATFAKSLESHFISAGPGGLSKMESICPSLAEEDARATNRSKYRLPSSLWLAILKYLDRFRNRLADYCPCDATRPRMNHRGFGYLLFGGGQGLFLDFPDQEARLNWVKRIRSTNYFRMHEQDWIEISLLAEAGSDVEKDKQIFLEKCMHVQDEVPVASIEGPLTIKVPASSVANNSAYPKWSLASSSLTTSTTTTAEPAAFTPSLTISHTAPVAVGTAQPQVRSNHSPAIPPVLHVASTPRRSGRVIKLKVPYVISGDNAPSSAVSKKKKKKRAKKGKLFTEPVALQRQQDDRMRVSKEVGAQLQGEAERPEKEVSLALEKSSEQMQLENELNIANETLRLLGRMKDTNSKCENARGNVRVDMKG